MEDLDQYATGVQIVQYDYPNPFFVNEECSKYRFTKTKLLADEYDGICILTLRERDEPYTESEKNRIKLFFQSDSEISELKAQSDLITLIKAPFSLVNTETIRKGLVVVENDFLEFFNHNVENLSKKELVFLMLETSETNVQNWVSLYQSESNLDFFIQTKIFSSYYNLNDSLLEEEQIKLLSMVEDLRFWSDFKNLNLSTNEKFQNRKFNLSFESKWDFSALTVDKELKNALKILGEEIKEKTAYQTEIANPDSNNDGLPDKLKNRISYFSSIKESDLNLDRNLVRKLLIGHSMTEHEKYTLLCNLLISRKYCHYVLTDSEILNRNSDIFEKYKPIFRYVIGYAWISLYMQEQIRKSKIVQKDRFVFDLDSASKLPVFPFAWSNPKNNPYFTLLVSDTSYQTKINLGGVKQILECQSGIVDLTEFKRRLNIFMTSNSNHNLLEGADWSNMVITGGCMAGIMPKFNPLMKLFKKDNIDISDTELDSFFQEYYGSSDIDIACNHDNIIDYIKHVKNLKEILRKNLGNVVESEINIVPNKSLGIYISSTLLKEKCSKGDVPFEYDYIIKNKTKRDVKFYFYEMYLEEKRKVNQTNKKILGDLIKDEAYFELINNCELDKTTLIINDWFLEEVKDNKIPELNSGLISVFKIEEKNSVFMKFSETLKYKINSKHFKHTFEVFRINEKEFFSCIARFHLPCVRSYYNGSTCYVLPSAITSYHTLTNIEFKYFVGSHDPISIINKYRRRGYTTILNKTESKQYLSYIMSDDNIKKSYGISDTKDISKAVGLLEVSHGFFCGPDFILEGTGEKLRKEQLNLKYLESDADLQNYYKSKYPKVSDFYTYQTISKNGDVNPFKKWIIEAVYDLCS